ALDQTVPTPPFSAPSLLFLPRHRASKIIPGCAIYYATYGMLPVFDIPQPSRRLSNGNNVSQKTVGHKAHSRPECICTAVLGTVDVLTPRTAFLQPTELPPL
ncbi:unnamed protein product, partial [Ectocarpus sp. 8 AP-2014]